MGKEIIRRAFVLAGVVPWLVVGCRSVQEHRREADEAANEIIAEKQQQALGKTEPFTIERPEDTLRRRLLLEQELPFSGPSSLGTTDLEPIKYWPKDDYLDPEKRPPASQPVAWQEGVLKLTLMEALQVAAHNSRDYQTRKEQIFIDALSLELERDEFRASFASVIANRASVDLGGEDAVAGVVSSPDLSVSQRFLAGGSATVRLAFDLAKLLTQDRSASRGLAVDTSIAIPLMRGAGRHIVLEPLTQAERNVAYDLLEFEQFKRAFAVNIASSYLSVLRGLDQIQNRADAYRRIIISTRRSRRLAEAGLLRPLEYDQALQQELQARDNWIAAQQAYKRDLDTFKVQLGLPPDALIELDRDELSRLAEVTRAALGIEAPSEEVGAVTVTTQPSLPTTEPIVAGTQPLESTTQPSDAGTQPTRQPGVEGVEEVVLVEPGREDAGPYELPEERALQLALENRPDLRVAQGEVYDAQRRVVVAANALEAGLNLTARGSFGERRGGVGSAVLPDAELRPEEGFYDVGLDADLPLERTREQSVYRTSLISLERATRVVQQLEDEIKLSVLNQLRSLLQNRESLRTQVKAVAIAQRRVAQTDMLLQAGRAEMRDVLEAQDALVNAQNALTSALVNYRVAELQLQRDLGLLEVNNEGLWREYSPEENVQ